MLISNRARNKTTDTLSGGVQQRTKGSSYKIGQRVFRNALSCRDSCFVSLHTQSSPHLGWTLQFHPDRVLSRVTPCFSSLFQHPGLEFHQSLKPISVSPQGILHRIFTFISISHRTERQVELREQRRKPIEPSFRGRWRNHISLSTKSKFPRLTKESAEEMLDGKFITAVYLITRWLRLVLWTKDGRRQKEFAI